MQRSGRAERADRNGVQNSVRIAQPLGSAALGTLSKNVKDLPGTMNAFLCLSDHERVPGNEVRRYCLRVRV